MSNVDLARVQFAMNWSAYSRFVGDVFGAPLAMEGLAAFFLESTFLGLWLFGWGRLPKRIPLVCIWAVAIGTAFSALYLPVVLILIGLIIRGVAFEYRGKRDSDRWRTTWSMALVVGSTLVPLLLAVGLGDLLSGLRVNAQQEFTGNFWNLLTAYGLATGIAMLALCLLHGATFLMLKTTGDVHAAARGFARRVAWPAAAIVLGFVIWTHVISGHGVLLAPLQVVAVLAAIAAAWLVEADHEGWAFAATAATILSSIGSIFVALYPNVLVSSTNAAYNLTVGNSASGAYALKVMTVVAVVLFPVVLLYQGWTYYVFRRRVVAAPAAPDQPSEPAAVPAG